MKYLVATNQTQGQRKSDFTSVPEGEIVRPASDGGDHFIGILCNTVTTTARVVDDPAMTPEAYRTTMRDALRAAGWLGLTGNPAQDEADLTEMVEEMTRAAAAFAPGAVVEVRGDHYRERSRPQSQSGKRLN